MSKEQKQRLVDLTKGDFGHYLGQSRSPKGTSANGPEYDERGETSSPTHPSGDTNGAPGASLSKKQLDDRLRNLYALLVAWDDPTLERGQELAQDTRESPRKARHDIKHKGYLRKSERRLIHRDLRADAVTILEDHLSSLIGQGEKSVEGGVVPVGGDGEDRRGGASDGSSPHVASVGERTHLELLEDGIRTAYAAHIRAKNKPQTESSNTESQGGGSHPFAMGGYGDSGTGQDQEDSGGTHSGTEGGASKGRAEGGNGSSNGGSSSPTSMIGVIADPDSGIEASPKRRSSGSVGLQSLLFDQVASDEGDEGGATSLSLVHQLRQLVDSKKSLSTKDLADLLSYAIVSSSLSSPSDFPDLQGGEDDGISSDLEARYKAAVKALERHETHADRALRVTSLAIAVPTGFSCGFMTGGMLFFFLMGIGVGMPIAITFAAIAFLAGFVANYNYFSKTVEEFFHKITHGGLTEYIDDQGQRTQLSSKTKLLLGLSVFAALAVGLTVGFFTFWAVAEILTLTTALASVAMILTLNPWILAIVLALSVVHGIAMGVIMFKAVVDVAPKLSVAYMRQAVRDFFHPKSSWELFKRITKVLFVPFLLFGLAMLTYLGLQSLVTSLTSVVGVIGAQIVAWTASLPTFFIQAVFVAKTGAQFCDFILGKLESLYLYTAQVLRGSGAQPAAVLESSTAATSQANNQPLIPLSTSSSPALLARVGDVAGAMFRYAAITANAAGNAALVIGASPAPLDIAGGVAEGFVSASGNLLPPNDSFRDRRVAANQETITQFFHQPSRTGASCDGGGPSASETMSRRGSPSSGGAEGESSTRRASIDSASPAPTDSTQAAAAPVVVTPCRL